MAKLTNRQREVFVLVAQGKTQLEIARHLHITRRTVKAHYWGIKQRTGSASITEAAVKLARSTSDQP